MYCTFFRKEPYGNSRLHLLEAPYQRWNRGEAVLNLRHLETYARLFRLEAKVTKDRKAADIASASHVMPSDIGIAGTE
jgi:hypothetical protein